MMAFSSLTQEVLEKFINAYKHFSDEDKNCVIDAVITASGPDQLLYLSKLLPDLVFRDFIRFLPLELVQKILQHLEGQQLLICCQVSKIWSERIDSLPIIWRSLAETAGADLQAVKNSAKLVALSESKDNLISDSSYYKNLYLQTVALLKGLESGQSIRINENYIDKDSWRITSLAYQFGNIVTGCDDHTVQIWSIPEGALLKSVATHSVSCLKLTETHLFTASFNANAECWDLASGYHCQSLCGHTSAVIAIDVLPSRSYVLTGSVDKTAKLWHLGTSASELVKTFAVYNDWVFHVKFLPCNNDHLLLFTCDSLQAVVWHVDLEGASLSSCRISAFQGSRFTSFYHYPQDPFVVFACQWTEEQKTSSLSEHIIRPGLLVIETVSHFSIPQDAVKAFLLGAGKKFAVIMCSISRKDFHIIDIQQRIVVATILTPDFCMLTRNGSTVTLCDTAWLDGFNFYHLKTNSPVFAACVGRNTVILGTWNMNYRSKYYFSRKKND
ncbi:hypothetical protein Btru_029011 [Bulinus truncatus]|nr:hypothetical protein Btru_029011 [Bulinus truncatus]